MRGAYVSPATLSMKLTLTFSTGERLENNEWVAIAPLNTPRRSLALGVLGGPMYALGGYDGASSLKSVERYDPQSNSWTSVSFLRVDISH